MVEITGDGTASGTSQLLALYGAGEDSYLAAGKYEERYVRGGHGWLIKSMRLRPHFSVPLAAGWAGVKRHYLVNSGEQVPDYPGLAPNLRRKRAPPAYPCGKRNIMKIRRVYQGEDTIQTEVQADARAVRAVTGRTLPALRPDKLWYAQPVYYLNNRGAVGWQRHGDQPLARPWRQPRARPARRRPYRSPDQVSPRPDFGTVPREAAARVPDEVRANGRFRMAPR